MRCSGCGKEIPFHGSVCPFCQRDKSKDKEFFALAMALGLGLAVVGALVFGVWGFFGGFVVGVIIAGITSARKGGNVTKPPEVHVTNFAAPIRSNEGTEENRLLRIKEMYDKGLIDEAEYIQKKQEILKTF